MVISTSPGIEAIFGEKSKHPTDPGAFGWCYIPPARASWDTLMSNAKLVNQLTYEQLTKVQNMSRNDYQQFYKLLEALSNFKDDRTGEVLGSVDSWGEDTVLVMDDLSGASDMAMQCVVGGKPAKSQPDWQIAQDLVYNLVVKLVGDTKCSFVLLAHVDREPNEITGGTEVTTQTLGKKLGPKLPPKFDEVILAERNGTTFTWNTAAPGVALKTRRLPIATDLRPDFAQIIEGRKL
jgi:hypothetical protein